MARARQTGVLPEVFVNQYTQQLHNLDEVARFRLNRAIGRLRADAPNFRQSLADLFVSHAHISAEAAAEIARAFYQGASLYLTGHWPEVDALSGFDENPAYAAAFAIVDETASLSDMARQLGSALGYQINRAANRATRNCGRQDRRGPRFARVPTGTETCAWCITLAGLGFHYMSEETASHTHSGCDCRVVPSWSGTKVEGYDPDGYRDMWREADSMRQSGDIPEEVLDRIDTARERARDNDREWSDDLNGTEIVMRWMYGLK